MANNSRDEPSSAPQSGRWFDLTLGPSFASDSSSKFCTLRYEFKPASIDKTKPGSLHKTTENRVTVEFQNNQSGKPKVAFDGSSEDYKENDAVLFFDGRSFRLERLHRAVKQLRLRRDPGESAAAMADPTLSPGPKSSKPMPKARTSVPPVPVEVERIDIGEPDNPGAKGAGKGITDRQPESSVVPSAPSPGPKEDEAEDHQDIDIDDIFGECTPDHDEKMDGPETDFDIDHTAPQQNDSDDEIADVENSGDDEAERGPNAAEALRAQVNAGEKNGRSSSSSSSSGSGSSGSGSSSSSSSSDSEGSEEDSVNSI